MLGKNKSQCKALLLSLSEHLDRAFNMVQALDDGQIRLVDTARYADTIQLVEEIVAELNGEAALALRDRTDEAMSVVESAVYFPAVTGTAAYFTLDPASKQSRDWHHHLHDARVDITYALDQLESF